MTPHGRLCFCPLAVPNAFYGSKHQGDCSQFDLRRIKAPTDVHVKRPTHHVPDPFGGILKSVIAVARAAAGRLASKRI
jgi:hypothetical protein